MSEIKVGEYVRTKKGRIAKVCAYQDLTTYDDKGISVTFHSFDTDKGTIADIEVAKYSKDIIDLVTMEDIFKIKEGNIIAYIGFTNNYAEEYADFIEQVKNKKIELLEVLTKEQFLANSYKVGE